MYFEILIANLYLFSVILLLIDHSKKRNILKEYCENTHDNKELKDLTELAKQYTGEDCLIQTIHSQIEGTVKEVSKNTITIEKNNEDQIINLNYVIRIRKHPRNKKGKKKFLILY